MMEERLLIGRLFYFFNVYEDSNKKPTKIVPSPQTSATKTLILRGCG
ncbi:hypothetical protein HG66A1_61650 [Gimesia chilikensis]|uniref:Uncharacterized protein n=1 Tax=Gimesia chilikensis TaxID=2605989 RepID=A0A517PY82_9PLAN|nr:hypothetical protein HG66A1_61650 [Gimesia chilikensis]